MAKTEVIERLKLYIENNLSKKRFIHCENVANQSAKIATIYNIDRESCYNAGLFHDIARELSSQQLLFFAKKWKNGIEPWEEENPILLHGCAGAYMLNKLFNIDDALLLNAVEVHSLGGANISSVAKVLIVADFTEPQRDFDNSYFNDLIGKISLNALLLEVAMEHKKFNDKVGRKNYVQLLSMIDWLSKECPKENI